MIFNIQRFSIHDGPGIRTTVFFKGCNLRCYWCHNPESWDGRAELSYYKNRCIGCGQCARVCARGCLTGAGKMPAHPGADKMAAHPGEFAFDIDRGRCARCGACTRACAAGALSITGKMYNVGEVMDIVAADEPFYIDSGGGMTCSGGEPLLQHRFAAALLGAAKASGLHTALDTAGHVGYEAFENVLHWTDLILFDLKCMDSELHKKATGADNRLIIENLQRLSRDGACIWIRIPVIPGFNDNEHNMRATADLLAGMRGVQKLELLPFHSLGSGKFESLGMDQGPHAMPQPPDEEALKTLASFFDGAHYEVLI